MALPPEHQGRRLKELAALGYKNIDLSFVAAATWNEAGKEIVLERGLVQGQDMGTSRCTGPDRQRHQGSVQPDDAAAPWRWSAPRRRRPTSRSRTTACSSATWPKAAKEQKTTPEALRTHMRRAAPFVRARPCSATPDQAQALGQAIAPLHRQARQAHDQRQPKDPAGLGITDAMLGPSRRMR